MADVTTATSMAQLGSLLADPSRSQILCALMDGRAHTGSELSRHIGVAASTISEHLSRLLDAGMVAVEAQGRHRYYRLAGADIAELLETLGASITTPASPKAPADLRYARTCYDHLAGELAVAIYDQLLLGGHLVEVDHHLMINRPVSTSSPPWASTPSPSPTPRGPRPDPVWTGHSAATTSRAQPGRNCSSRSRRTTGCDQGTAHAASVSAKPDALRSPATSDCR